MAATALLIWSEIRSACPPGGALAFAGCGARGPVIAWVGLSASLYVAGLSVVLRWASRRAADRVAVRDWYLVAAVAGLLVAPLTAFTLVAALGWLG